MELYKKQSIVLAVILLLLQNLTACSDSADSDTMHTAPFEKVSQKIFVPELVHVEFDTDIFVDSEPGVSMEFDSSYVYTGCITSSGVYLTAEARKAVGTSGGITAPEGYSTPASDASEVYPIYIYGVSLFSQLTRGRKMPAGKRLSIF